ncbi:MAG: B-4DMT family transporter [Mycobacterium sp.]|uniref:B-4DMT family transporter n=1 Tax=Mycobacterium sp. TaxID=1785 RepID=UPI001EB76B78|nr:B-4DMT family transporter [Mycobacterium sp.]MBW0016899.1 B-4DMT family transporter [Mycobacterium sp.]
MNKWMMRGLVFAAAMVVLRLIQGAMINAWQTQSGLISIVLLTFFIVGVIVWGVMDGRADAKANPDPDRRADLAMTWLLAGLIAGLISGAVAWLISLFYKGLYTGGLLNEVTTFAAFTALIVFVPGIIGVAFGHWRVDRSAPEAPQHDGSRDRDDTDVFAAVRDDDTATGERAGETAPAHSRSAAPTAVAVADREAEREAPTEAAATTEREAPTEVIRTTETDAPTESFKLPSSEDKTEVIRTHDPDKTQQGTIQSDIPKKD